LFLRIRLLRERESSSAGRLGHIVTRRGVGDTTESSASNLQGVLVGVVEIDSCPWRRFMLEVGLVPLGGTVGSCACSR